MRSIRIINNMSTSTYSFRRNKIIGVRIFGMILNVLIAGSVIISTHAHDVSFALATISRGKMPTFRKGGTVRKDMNNRIGLWFSFMSSAIFEIGKQAANRRKSARNLIAETYIIASKKRSDIGICNAFPGLRRAYAVKIGD